MGRRCKTWSPRWARQRRSGSEVEIDEVCFRARWKRDGSGAWGKEWHRYIAAHERHGGPLILKALPVRFAKGHGQGGGGSLTDEELHDFIMRPGTGAPPLLRPGTIVHTDGARAYRNLDWRTEAGAPPRPTDDIAYTATLLWPGVWRRETFQEC